MASIVDASAVATGGALNLIGLGLGDEKDITVKVIRISMSPVSDSIRCEVDFEKA
jgi:hypothetical protein